MSKFNFTGYIHDIATKLKDVAHVDNDSARQRFYRVSSIQALEEFIQTLPEFKGFALAVEDNEEGNYLLNGAGTLFDDQHCGFFLLTKAKLMNAEDRGDKIREAELVMRKILSKIRKDYHTDNQLKSDIGLKTLDWNTVHYFSFGPVLDNCYGVYCNFILPTIQNFIYNEGDWLG
jgi:hypothetical protein